MIFRRPPEYESKEPRPGFACLIPARNEEQVIGRSVGSLLAQDYPRGLFEVFVIPNNCSDGTEAAALAAGAKV
ncbi:MAG: glycosyltransferase, partial [Eubacterium sp.]|nr:glycosyltransferase [Eubacterium sp.]